MSQSQLSRRQLLKILAAVAGTTALSSVPNKWKTPVVDVGMLPAHAQTLSGLGAISGTIDTPLPPAPVHNSPHAPAPVDATITATNTITSATYQTLVKNATFPFSYTISNVPPGTYDVKCDLTTQICLNSYTLTDFGIIVPPNGTATANFNFTDCPYP